MKRVLKSCLSYFAYTYLSELFNQNPGSHSTKSKLDELDKSSLIFRHLSARRNPTHLAAKID